MVSFVHHYKPANSWCKAEVEMHVQKRSPYFWSKENTQLLLQIKKDIKRRSLDLREYLFLHSP